MKIIILLIIKSLIIKNNYNDNNNEKNYNSDNNYLFALLYNFRYETLKKGKRVRKVNK